MTSATPRSASSALREGAGGNRQHQSEKRTRERGAPQEDASAEPHVPRSIVQRGDGGKMAGA